MQRQTLKRSTLEGVLSIVKPLEAAAGALRKVEMNLRRPTQPIAARQ